ncbi:MAG: type 1 glutamine amidotransferase [Chloroflexi bacterium]|nr:type 1 glutamine amidotransferase [Chloroflexota bacterium]
MAIKTPLKFCIVNGYPKRSRDVLDVTNVTQAHDLYLMFLRIMLPNSEFDLLFIADSEVAMPTAEEIAAYDGIIWTGSNLTIYHDNEEVTRQIEYCRAVFEVGVPQFGSCWAAQMAAMAAGGACRRNPNGREWSIARNITLTEAGKNHPMYIGKQHQFNGFIMHLDEVCGIPEGATVLATNEHTDVQAITVKHSNGEFWSTQYHPEFTLYEMAQLIGARKEAIVKEGFFKNESEMESLVNDMITLSKEPNNAELRQKLNIGDSILDDDIRQKEVHNWVEYLVVPS